MVTRQLKTVRTKERVKFCEQSHKFFFGKNLQERCSNEPKNATEKKKSCRQFSKVFSVLLSFAAQKFSIEARCQTFNLFVLIIYRPPPTKQ